MFAASELGRRFAFRRAAPELVWQGFSNWSEVEAHRVDAVALARRWRAVVEYVPLVGSAARAHDLGPDHAVTGVPNIFEVPFGERLGEARPAGSALELGSAVEQRQPAQPAGEHAWPFLVEEHAAKRRLGAMLEKDVLLFLVEVSH